MPLVQHFGGSAALQHLDLGGTAAVRRSNANKLAANACVQSKPKHHWLLNVPAQIAKDNVVLDAFVIERQHVLVKANDASQCTLTGQGGEYVNVILKP